MSPPLVSPRAFAVEGLVAKAGALTFAHPTDDALRSPFDEENALAATLGRYGPHLIAGRLAAHAALAAAKVRPRALLRRSTGEADWPAEVVGAITHTRGLAVAVVAPAADFHGVGVDVERRGRLLGPGTRRILSRPEEHGWLDAPPALPGQPLLLLAGAKEVIFKVYFPPTGVRLAFDEAIVQPRPGGGFDATVTRELGLPPRLSIRCVESGEHLILGGALPR